MRNAFALAVTAWALMCQGAVAANTSYEVSYVPNITVPMGINNVGAVLGYNGDSSRSVWLWSPQQGVSRVTGIDIGGMGLNDQGTIVGEMPGYVGDRYVAVPRRVGADGTVTTLTNYNDIVPYTGNAAEAINNRGQVGGTLYQGISQGWQAVRWEADGSVTNLNLQDAGFYSSYGYDINEHGTVVGYGLKQAVGEVAFVADGNSVRDIGGLPAPYGNPTNWTIASAINNAGQVVGESGYSGEYATITDAFIWDADGGMRSLGVRDLVRNYLSSSARDINDAGVVVGSYSVLDAVGGGFMWTPDGGVVDLNTLLSVQQQATTKIRAGISVNDRGQILSAADEFDGTNWVTRTLVLTPVPEPSTLATLSLGLVGLALMGRGRAKKHFVQKS